MFLKPRQSLGKIIMKHDLVNFRDEGYDCIKNQFLYRYFTIILPSL